MAGAEAKPELVIIEAGINDLKTIPLMPEREEKIVGDCVANLMRCARMGSEAGARVLVLSVLPAGKVEWQRRLVWSDAVGRAVVEVNRRLASECTAMSEGVRFVDVSGLVEVEQDYVDTLHFNAGFYARLSERVMAEGTPKSAAE